MNIDHLDGVHVTTRGNRCWLVYVDGRLAGWVRAVDPPDKPRHYSALSRSAARQPPRHRDDLPLHPTRQEALLDVLNSYDAVGGQLRPGLDPRP